MDIYFTLNWGIVNETIENGKAKFFEIKTEKGIIRNMFILRKVPFLVEGKQYYDITTPYGYGGPIIENCLEENKEELLKKYKEEFQKYCEKNGIISEFVRFHPILKNYLDFKEIYNIKYLRHTVGTDLASFEDVIQNEFSKSCKRNIKNALKVGVTWKIIESPESADEFIKIYYSTMDRRDAKDFYYFSKDYFEKCIKIFKENIVIVQAIFEGKTIAAGFYLVYNDIIHIHLSGTLSEYLNLSPAYVLRYAITLWGKEKGYSLIHHGGGTSNDLNDSLYQFKLKFTKNTIFDFYVGKKIWNSDIYNKLVKERNLTRQEKESEYFPLYRI